MPQALQKTSAQKPITPKLEARISVWLSTGHPLCSENPLLVGTKLLQLLNRPEHIEDIQMVLTELALVATTPSQA